MTTSEVTTISIIEVKKEGKVLVEELVKMQKKVVKLLKELRRLWLINGLTTYSIKNRFNVFYTVLCTV